MWGSLASCVAVGNRHVGRLPIGPQVINLPHRLKQLLLDYQLTARLQATPRDSYCPDNYSGE